MNTISPVSRPAPPDVSVHSLIAGRWSSRAIDDSKDVPPELMTRLYEAARWAPSAANNQPWRFLAFGPEDSDALSQARSSLTPMNYWALKAPRLLFILTRTDRPGGGINPRAAYEAGMAASMMALQANAEGLVFHQMAGFSADQIRASFSVPAFYEIITAAAVGWPGSPDGLTDKHREQEVSVRTRKPLNALVFPNGAVPVAGETT